MLCKKTCINLRHDVQLARDKPADCCASRIQGESRLLEGMMREEYSCTSIITSRTFDPCPYHTKQSVDLRAKMPCLDRPSFCTPNIKVDYSMSRALFTSQLFISSSRGHCLPSEPSHHPLHCSCCNQCASIGRRTSLSSRTLRQPPRSAHR